MNFIDAIKLYQSEGNAEIIKRIRFAMNTDFLAYRQRGGTAAMDTPELRIAFRCIRLISGLLSTVKYTLSEEGVSAREDSPEYVFADYARSADYIGISLTLDTFKQHERELRRYFSATYPELDEAYSQLIGERATRYDEVVRDIIDERWPDILISLEYAISRVDVTRSEGEIIRYINMAIRTQYTKIQTEGLRRVRRKGDVKYVEPRYLGEIYTIFGTQQFRVSMLTALQRKLIDRISAIITGDFNEGKPEHYAVDLNGGYRIVNRYIAERVGVHEASLSRALTKMKSVKH